jgi:hypothetical protein
MADELYRNRVNGAAYRIRDKKVQFQNPGESVWEESAYTVDEIKSAYAYNFQRISGTEAQAKQDDCKHDPLDARDKPGFLWCRLCGVYYPK